jgi:ADP-ribose pyrophosphatase YjhB (NUDIX family)
VSRPRDLPAGRGLGGRLHYLAGSLAILATGLFRPRLTLGVRLAAFDAEGRVFLVRHSYLPGWYLPGGGVETGETARDAVMREAREEGGLELAAEPALFHLYHNVAPGRRDHVALFVAHGVSAAGERPRGLEIVEAGFFEPGKLPETATPATRARVGEVLGGRPAGDLW